MNLKKMTVKFFGFVIILVSSIDLSNASIINSDYSSQNDGLAVYDNATNLIWLDLTLTTGMTLTQALEFDNTFRLANYNEVVDLFKKIFPHFVSKETIEGIAYQEQYPEMNDDLERWFSLFGQTLFPEISYGFYFNKENHRKLMGAYDSRRNGSIDNPVQRVISPGYEQLYDHRESSNIIGYFLVKKAAINEPSTTVIFILGIIFLSINRIRNHPLCKNL